jgi:digeranylgeranylglycerophospholipid reductase
MGGEFDVVIIGAGCAGLMCAQLLARKNISVALIDSKKDLLDLSFLTLGSFMDIKKYELSEKVIASHINKGSFYSKRFSVSKSGSNVAIIDKKQLHKELIDKCVEYGVNIFTDSRITDATLGSDSVIEKVKDKHGHLYKGKIYIDASGTAGLLSKKLGLQETSFPLAVGLEYNASYTGDPHEVIFFIGPEYAGGYGWIFPLKNQRAIVGFGSFNPKIRCNLKQGLAAVIADNRVSHLINIDNKTTYGGNIPITAVNRTMHTGNLVCVGDSVSQVNPLVGEGYKFILDSSIMAVSAISAALTHSKLDLLKNYETEWTATNHAHFSNSKRLQSLLARMHQYNWLTDIGLLFLKFKRAKTVTRIISGQFGKIDLLFP